jgi:hypothetical protein
MITIIDVNKFNNTLTMYGLSSDAKPTDKTELYEKNYLITNGSTFYEMDTKTAFLFDETNKEWLQQ